MSLQKLFKGIFDSDFTMLIDVKDFLLCIAMALVIGILIGLCYTYKTRHTKSFVVTLALLPAIVCVVIMMVNGNIGAGVAVAGAFSLVRFRSVPGSAKEIAAIFMAMGAGLVVGMGYLAYALLFTLLLCAMLLLFSFVGFGDGRKGAKYVSIKITIPEDLDYTGVFDDILARFATTHELVQVKTVNMGSMFRLTYDLQLKKDANQKDMIDEIRTRNGNLEVLLSRQEGTSSEL